jgi:hypothetical protein
MATETTNDAVISTGGVPASEQANIGVTSTDQGTVISNSGTTSGLVAEVTGSVVATGGTYSNAVFSFAAPAPGGANPSLTVAGTTMEGTTIVGQATPDVLSFRGSASAKSTATTVTKSTTASLGGGDDSVAFFKKTLDKNSTYRLEGGADSITFGKGSSSKSAIVNLGKNDQAGDVVDISRKADIKDLKIRRFSSDDTLKIGGKTFDYDKLQDLNGKVGKNITVKFD